MMNSSRNEVLNQPAKQAEGFSPGWSERSERLSLLILLLVFVFSGCSRETQTGTNSRPLASPEPISSSEQAVKLSVWPVMIPPNGSADAVVTLTISPGYHINANPASFPYLIATELQPGKLEGIRSGKPLYPAPVKKKFQFDEHLLAVYEGKAEMRLPLTNTATSPAGDRSLPIKLRVQACDHEKCYAPSTIESSITVR